MRLAEVLVDELRHLEHRNRPLATEHRLQLRVGVDVATVLLVLQAVALDIGPDLLRHFGARHRAAANDFRQRRRRFHRLHERSVRLALRLLLRHLIFSSDRTITERLGSRDSSRPRAAVPEQCPFPRGKSIENSSFSLWNPARRSALARSARCRARTLQALSHRKAASPGVISPRARAT